MTSVFAVLARLRPGRARTLASTAARHPYPAWSDQAGEFARSPEARARLDVVAVLAQTRQQVLARVRMLHPEPRCLPVPELRVPTTEADLPLIEHYAIGVGASLLDQDCGTSPRWESARLECRHAPDCIVEEINGLFWQWYRLLIAADRLVLRGGKRAAREVAWHVWNVRRYIENMPTREDPDAQIQETTAERVRDGQEFSLDGGDTWYVRTVAYSISGGVVAYTGEHDMFGFPKSMYLDTEPGQAALIRVAPESVA